MAVNLFEDFLQWEITILDKVRKENSSNKKLFLVFINFLDTFSVLICLQKWNCIFQYDLYYDSISYSAVLIIFFLFRSISTILLLSLSLCFLSYFFYSRFLLFLFFHHFLSRFLFLFSFISFFLFFSISFSFSLFLSFFLNFFLFLSLSYLSLFFFIFLSSFFSHSISFILFLSFSLSLFSQQSCTKVVLFIPFNKSLYLKRAIVTKPNHLKIISISLSHYLCLS